MVRKFQKESESLCEYILPDYLGDVKKLLSSSAKAIPSGQFNTDEGVEASGIVTYELVYLDSENKLSSASFSSDYDLSFTVNSESFVDSYVSTAVSGFNVRLTGPRKMIAKSNLLTDVYLIEDWEPTVGGTAFDGTETPEKITKTVKIQNAMIKDGGEREYAEEAASLEGISADDIEIITSNAYVRISESTPIEGGVNIKGNLIVTAIIRTPESSVFAIRREIPFDEDVSIEGASPEMSVISEAVVTSVSCGVAESENAATVNANVIMELKCLLLYNEEKEIILDAYLKSKDTETKYDTVSYVEHISAETKELAASLKLQRAEIGMENVKEILSLNCELKAQELEDEQREPQIKAEAVFSGVACEINEDGSTSQAPIKFTSPISINVNLSCQKPKGSTLDVTLSPSGCEYNIESDEIYIKPSFTATLRVGYEKSESCLSFCEPIGELEYSSSLSTVCVYYPDDDETLFDVAKKFHTTVKDIALDNSIADPVSTGTPKSSGFKKLIIR